MIIVWVDGALGGLFVRRVADYLEQFDMNRENLTSGRRPKINTEEDWL